jgi:hypothetical protein
VVAVEALDAESVASTAIAETSVARETSCRMLGRMGVPPDGGLVGQAEHSCRAVSRVARHAVIERYGSNHPVLRIERYRAVAGLRRRQSGLAACTGWPAVALSGCRQVDAVLAAARLSRGTGRLEESDTDADVEQQ